MGVDVPAEVKEWLVKCLRASIDFFAISPREIPEINYNVEFYQVNVDPNTQYVSYRRRWRSPKKAQATTKTIQGLLDANFISKVKYTKWIYNVVLVKKASRKQICMSVYVDLCVCRHDYESLKKMDMYVGLG